MNKYTIVVTIIAIALGIVVGSSFVSNKSKKELEKLKIEHEKKLEHQSDSLVEVVHKRDKKLFDLDQHIKSDSIKIQGLLYKIQQDGVKTEQKRAVAKKFNSDEKVDFILKRYTH